MQSQSSTGDVIVEEVIITEVLAGSTLDGAVGLGFRGNRSTAAQLERSVIAARHQYSIRNHPPRCTMIQTSTEP